MSKIRTLEELKDKLDDFLVWRRQELLIVQKMIHSSENESKKNSCLIRAGVALLYAHWEGFVKESGIAYLNFVSMQGLKYEELAPNFIALAMKTRLNEASQTKKSKIYNEVVDFFLSGLSEKSKLPHDSKAINTESNLSSEVLQNIIYSLGLDYRDFEVEKDLIDDKLLKNRNTIAHGNYLTHLTQWII